MELVFCNKIEQVEKVVGLIKLFSAHCMAVSLLSEFELHNRYGFKKKLKTLKCFSQLTGERNRLEGIICGIWQRKNKRLPHILRFSFY